MTSVCPSVIASTLASWPWSRSSITRRSPASPKALSRAICSDRVHGLVAASQTNTPLPAASPSALTTIGTSSRSWRNRIALSASRNVWYSPDGTAAFRRMSLQKALLASSSAAARLGPKRAVPRARRRRRSRQPAGLPARRRQAPRRCPWRTGSGRGNRRARGSRSRRPRPCPRCPGREHPLDSGALSDLPHQGVFPPAVADHQHLHRVATVRTGVRVRELRMLARPIAARLGRRRSQSCRFAVLRTNPDSF